MKETERAKDGGGSGDKRKEGDSPLPFCTTAPSAEHARASDEDAPCEDFRGGPSGGEKGGSMRHGDEERIVVSEGDALVIVDVQRDFLPGGRLGVPEGDAVVPVIQRLIRLFDSRGLPVIATRDWHPPDHVSFIARGGPWPAHCVAGTEGAEFAPGLGLPKGAILVSKAATPDRDAYSGFEGTDLSTRLKGAGVRRLFVGGLATDYCVLTTVRDACRLGYRVFLITDAVKAVNVKPGDGQRALDEMKGLGAILIAAERVS